MSTETVLSENEAGELEEAADSLFTEAEDEDLMQIGGLPRTGLPPLNAEESKRFIAMIEAPPRPPTARMLRALETYRRLMKPK